MPGLKNLIFRLTVSFRFDRKYSSLYFRQLILSDIKRLCSFKAWERIKNVDKVKDDIVKELSEMIEEDLIYNEAEYQFTNSRLHPLSLKLKYGKRYQCYYIKLHGSKSDKEKLLGHSYPVPFESKRERFNLRYVFKCKTPSNHFSEVAKKKFITLKSYIHE